MSVMELPMPAPLYDAALAFCNERLAAAGKPPIQALPAGQVSHANHCPCANGCGASVWRDTWYQELVEAGRIESGEVGGLLHDFIIHFDNSGAFGDERLPVRMES